MKMKKSCLFLLILSILLVSCTNRNNKQELKVGDEIALLNDIKYDYKNAFFDDFSNGINNENWIIGEQHWGGNNGGVIPENVSYTDDGILLLRGTGGYYQEGEVKGVGDVKDGRYTGATLISNFTVKPGRYEIKMKVLPRIGACTAFWTYANTYPDPENLNHEIDIELPGGNRSGVVSFENIINTNYIKEDRSHSQDTKISTLFNDKEIYLNDGEWHTFGFDWYTNPEKVVYYIDGTICAISDYFVPSLHSRLWVGVWFPVSSAFVGSARFESDYMQVDYVSYIPFLDQPSTPFTPDAGGYANLNEYPTMPSNIPAVNKIANGSFEYIDQNNVEMSGWDLGKYLGEKQDIQDICFISDNAGVENSKGLTIKDGGVAEQKIDAVYHNFKHTLSFEAKGKGTATIYYVGASSMETLKNITLDIDCDEFTTYNLDLVAPENSHNLYVQFDTFDGDTVQIDNVNLFKV